MNDGNLDTAQAAKRLGLSKRTLEKYRTTGDGPPFLKFGKRVVYRPSDLEEYETHHLVRSTAETKARAA